MKYCKNCGMLLEDTHERCIGCGTDVTDPKNVSKYPPEMQHAIDSQKKNNRIRTVMVGAIIFVFVLLLVLLGVIIIRVSNLNGDAVSDAAAGEPAVQEESTADADTAESEGGLADGLNGDVIGEQEDGTAAGDAGKEADGETKAVKDDLGSYYTYTEVSDDGGSVVFSSVYPEDFTSTSDTIDYEKYSTKFPEFLTFVAGNEDNTVRFTYMSPQQFWYKDSETGNSKSNERDTVNYMSFFTYDGVESYIDALLEQGYPDAKKITLLETSDADEAVTDKLGELSEDYAKTLTGDIGDYAHIGENTTYAAMESEFSVSLLQYEITTKQSNTLYCEFYVPLVANHLYYANDDYDDRGTVTEWIVLDVMGYEAGNDELYDEFKDAFTVFMENTSVNRKFYYSNAMYGEEILKAVEEGETPDKLDVQKLKEYKNSYQESADIGDLNESILEFGETMSADERIAEADSYSFCISKDILAAYYNEDTKKVFFSPDETEYPGSGYIELEMQE